MKRALRILSQGCTPSYLKENRAVKPGGTQNLRARLSSYRVPETKRVSAGPIRVPVRITHMKLRNFLVFVALFIGCSGIAWSKASQVSLEDLEPTREQRQATLIILRVIDKYHYKEHRLDNDMSKAILQ